MDKAPRHAHRYVRFDTRKPAHARGLPLTLVVNRYTLLDILVERCRELGADVLHQGREVQPQPPRHGICLLCSP